MVAKLLLCPQSVESFLFKDALNHMESTDLQEAGPVALKIYRYAAVILRIPFLVNPISFRFNLFIAFFFDFILAHFSILRFAIIFGRSLDLML